MEVTKCTLVLSLIALKILLVFVCLVVHITVLFDLVMVNIQGSIVDVRQGGFGSGGLLRSLVANEGKGRLVWFLGFVELDGLDIAEFAEMGSQVSLVHVWWEAFDVKIASLLRVFVLESLMLEFSFTVCLTQGFSDVEFVAFDFSSVHFSDSLFSCFRTGLTIILVSRSKADEEIFAWLAVLVTDFDVVAHTLVDRSDVAVSFEAFSDLSFTPALGHVFEVNVIEGFSEVLSVSLWFVLYSSILFTVFCIF